VRILEKKTVFEGKFIRFVISRYSDSSGIIREWESFERVNCKGIVVIVPVTDRGEVVLVRQFRPPVNGHVIEFPAGLNDRGELLEDVARRELLEETGYAAGEMVFLAAGPMSSGASGEILTGFLAKGLEFRGIGERDEAEDIEVIKVPLPELDVKLLQFSKAGDFIDLKIYGLMALARGYLQSHTIPL
jgi:8-oxo-dGTP pyrophosphatase MutT (NUDIX family)